MLSQKLIQKTFSYYNSHIDKKEVVSPSLPILYFGDLEAFQRSGLKVITVAKNPSNIEFQSKKGAPLSFFRFRNWNGEAHSLIPALNAYFKDEPYTHWFSSFEPILNGMSASYYPKSGHHRALHTDLCSPLATDPTWSGLGSNLQAELFDEGLELWKDLVEEIQPDVMLVSIPKGLFLSVFPKEGNELIVFTEKKDGTPRKKPYRVERSHYQLRSGKQAKVIFGQASQKPFDTITIPQKNQIGAQCLK